jgi:spermidine synthase
MIEVSQTQKDMLKLNENSLNSDKVKIITTDAFKYIVKTEEKYDFIIADFPDPRDVFTSKLYTKEFYISLHGSLKKHGVFVTQASSSFFATKAFWSIEKTVDSVF